jgi:hypothetical protein
MKKGHEASKYLKEAIMAAARHAPHESSFNCQNEQERCYPDFYGATLLKTEKIIGNFLLEEDLMFKQASESADAAVPAGCPAAAMAYSRTAYFTLTVPPWARLANLSGIT